MKQFTARYLGMILLLFASTLNLESSAQDAEPNDDIATASSLSLNGTVTGDIYINPTDDADDYYQVILDDDGSFSGSLEISDGLNAYLRLYNKSGTQLAVSDYGGGPATVDLTYSCLAKDTVYLLVDRHSGSGTYSLSNTLTPPPPNNQDVEPNNSIETVTHFIHSGETVQGRMGYTGVGISDLDDYYGLIAGDDGNLTLDAVIDSSMNVYVRFFSKSGAQLGVSPYGTGMKSVSISCQANDTVYANMDRYDGCGSYSMTFTHQAPPPHEQDIEPNNTIATTSVFLSPGETVQGRMGYNGVNISDVDDYYGLIAGDDGNLTLDAVIDSSMNVYVRFYSKSGAQLGISPYGTGMKSVSISCQANDTVYANMDRYDGCGSYAMTFTHEAPPPHDQDIEPNNTIPTTSVFLSPGETVEGRMGYNGVNISDVDDYYGLIAGDDGNLTLDAVIDSSMNVYVRFYSKSGAQLGISPYGTGMKSVTISCQPYDTVYANMDRYDGCGSYSMTFTHEAPIYANDMEDNSSVATAIPLPTAALVEGHIGYNGVGITDNDDYYSFTVVQAPFELDAKLVTDDNWTGYLRLKTEAGSQLAITPYFTSGSINLTYTINTAGTYLIHVDRYSGCGSYQLGDLCAVYPDTPTISADGPLAFCDGESVNLTSSLATSYLWSNGETTQSISATEDGAYQVTAMGINGCPAESDPLSLTIFPLPTAEITANGPLELCETQDNVVLTSSVGVSYLWSTGETTASITVAEGGSYTVTVTDSNGCEQTSAPVVTISNPLPPVPTVSMSGPTTLCEGDSVTLTSSPAFGYSWTQGQTTQSITVGQNNTVHLLIVNDANGCLRAAEEGIVIYTLPNSTYYADSDGDGFGDISNPVDTCSQPVGFVTDHTDCDDTDEDIYIGASCDDGNENTVGDQILADCTCVGTLTFDCPALSANIGDACNDGDANTVGDEIQSDCTCAGSAAFDCPDISANFGDSCDDGDENTENDTVQTDCSCEGSIVFDCPSLEANIGDSCDDGDANTANDSVQSDCTCAGEVVFDCPSLQANIGDACEDNNPNTENDQVQDDCSCSGSVIGTEPANDLCENAETIYCGDIISGSTSEASTGLDVPTCSVFLNTAPGVWYSFVGEGSDVEATLCGSSYDTKLAVFAGDCSDLECLVASDDDFTCSSSGLHSTVNFTAEVDVEYYVYVTGFSTNSGDFLLSINCETPDCPLLGLNIGESCDDGDVNTSNDIVQDDCSCAGETVFDCPSLEANIGDRCNDGDETTDNDLVQDDCSCAGTSIYDCPVLAANIGDRCDDGDSDTENDTVQDDCTCSGTAGFDCPRLEANIGDRCNDGDPLTIMDQINSRCQCEGTPVAVTTQVQEEDCGGDYIWPSSLVYIEADYLVGAWWYEFRFTPLGGGEPQYATAYWIRLYFYDTNGPFETGDYSVDVRTFGPGGWTDYGPACDIHITNTWAERSAANEDDLDDKAIHLNDAMQIDLYPNPNDGDRFTLSLDSYEASDDEVLIEIFDMTGQRIHMQTSAVKKSENTLVIDPSTDLVPGLYLVQVQVGEERLTKRMSVH